MQARTALARSSIAPRCSVARRSSYPTRTSCAKSTSASSRRANSLQVLDLGARGAPHEPAVELAGCQARVLERRRRFGGNDADQRDLAARPDRELRAEVVLGAARRDGPGDRAIG